MIASRRLILALMACSFAPVSAQVRVPIAGVAAAQHGLSDAQASQLSRAIAQRTAVATFRVDPGKLAAAAGHQAPPVEVSGSQIVVTKPPAAPAPEAKPATQVEVVKTSLAEDKALAGEIAGKGRLRDALANPTSSIITLPGVVRMTSEGAPSLQLKPFIFVNQPLQRDASGLFKGELLIGVAEIADTGVSKSLPAPLLFQIVGAVKSEPERVLVDSTSPPFRTVEVWLNAVQGATATLRVLSMFDHGGTPVAVPVASELDVDTATGNIAGFGIETTKVTVSLNSPDAPGHVVTLHVQPSGYLDNSKLVLDSTGTAEAELRSGSIGTAQIRATSPGLAPVTAPVTYTFPLLTIIASILGGLLGSGANLFMKPDPNKSAARRLVGGVVYGTFVFVAYAVGVNLLPVKLAVSVGALSVLAVSALAAWFGPK